MSNYDTKQEQWRLRENARFLYEDREPIIKGEFFIVFWDILSSFVHHHNTSPLMADAVRTNPDLIPRAFAILSVLYGAFTYEPSRYDLLSAFIEMLGKDLTEEELTATLYADDATKDGRFFDAPNRVLKMIHDVYGSPDYEQKDLPPSPYLGFAFLALNHKKEVFHDDISSDKLGKLLHESHLSMLGVFQKIQGHRG